MHCSDRAQLAVERVSAWPGAHGPRAAHAADTAALVVAHWVLVTGFEYSPCNRRGRNSATISQRSEACHNGGQPLSAEACVSARGGYEHDGQPFDIAATNAALRGHRLARPSVLRIRSKDPQQVRAFPLDANLGLVVITHRHTHRHHSSSSLI